MTNLALTAFFTLALGGLYIGLIIQVILHRREKRIAHGDGGDKAMRGVIRAQMNAAEQMPIFLIAFAVAEWRGAWAWWLMLLGLTFLVGRLINAYGMSTGAHQLRVVGTAANLSGLIFVLLTLAITLV